MDQQLVIKLSETTGAPIGLVESPPMLYSNFKMLFAQHKFQDVASPQEVEQHGYGVYEWAWPPTNISYEESVNEVGLSKHQDGIWRLTFMIRSATQEEIRQRTDLKAQEIREERNLFLRNTDYTQLQDNGLTKEAVQNYAVYRQTLRDIPKQLGFPWEVVFPSMP